MEKIEIHYAPWRMLAILAGALAFVVLGLALATGKLAEQGKGEFQQIIGYYCTAFFGFVFLLGVWRWFSNTGPVITLTQTGIRDKRIAAQEIPWTAIERLGIWEYNSQKCIMLGLDPQVEARLDLTKMVQATRSINKALGADGLAISATGLKTGFQPLYDLVEANLQRVNGAQAANLPV